MNEEDNKELSSSDSASANKDSPSEGEQADSSVVSDLMNAIGLSSVFKKPDRRKNESADIGAEHTDLDGQAIGESFEHGNAPEHDTFSDESSSTSEIDGTDESEDDSSADSLDESSDTPHKKRRSSLKILIPSLAAIAAIAVAAVYFWPYITEPRPPSEDVVGSYNGKYITVSDLKDFIVIEDIREFDHAYCEIHGYEHELCDPSEPCEIHPIDSLEGYRETVSRMAMEQIILDWAEDKGISQREDVQHGLEDLLDDATVEQLVTQIHERELTAESIPKWEVQQYYDANRTAYEGREFSDAEHEIRDLLASQKDEEYIPQYIEELKKSAGLQVNFELLRVSDPAESDIEDYYMLNSADYQTAEKAEISEIRFSAADGQTAAEEAVVKIMSGESIEDVAAAYAESGRLETRTLEKGLTDAIVEAAVWALVPGEVSDPITASDGTVSIIRLESITPAGNQPLSEVRTEIADMLRLENMESEYTLRKDEALFSVHSRRYTLGDFYTEFKELPETYQTAFSSFETKQELLETFIAKELLLEEAGDASSTESEQHSFDELKMQYLAQVIHSEEVDGNITDATEEELRQFYDENSADLVNEENVKISLIWIDEGMDGEKREQAQIKAADALSLIRSGTEFAEVAKQYTEDGMGEYGGKLDVPLHRTDLPPELADPIFALQAGQVTGAIESDYGLYIIKVDEKNELKQLSYEDSVEAIKEIIKAQKHEQLEAEMNSALYEDANLIIYDRTLRKLVESQSQSE